MKVFLLISIITSLTSNPLYSTEYPFPKDFKWCVATAAHQIEGNNTLNDWWAWEHLTPSKIKNNEQSGLADDHWNRVGEDTELLSDLGVTDYRFSIEWSRIEPKEGQFSPEAINHYKYEINELKKKGISPMVTLHHFTSPQWFAKKGGWANPDSPKMFERFVHYTRLELGETVEQWITFNEPMVLLAGGDISGVFPPGITDWKKIQAPLKNILLAHAKAYKELHQNAKAQVGIAHHLRIMDPYNKHNPIEMFLANKLALAFNWTILNALKTGFVKLNVPTKINYHESIPEIKNTQDFIGVNYYSRDLIQFTPHQKDAITLKVNMKNPKSDLGWEIYPEGMYDILKEVHHKFKNLPLFITENGIADKEDKFRSQFLVDHLYEVQQAIQDGVPVKGYCHWSLYDNFEWAEGFAPRFGLFNIDYQTLKRTPRESALLYHDIIFKNSITK